MPTDLDEFVTLRAPKEPEAPPAAAAAEPTTASRPPGRSRHASAASQSYVHVVRPRYGEIDMQGVVFNAHYLAYCDDACDTWFRDRIGSFEGLGWDFMLKRAELTWHGAARLGDELAIDVTLERVGTTSFDIGFAGSVDDRPVFVARITYVCVGHGTVEPVPVPEVVRRQLVG